MICKRATAIVAVVGLFAACAKHAGSALPAKSAVSPTPSLEERIAGEILRASPPAGPADASARDKAAEQLSHIQELLDAAGERILWGPFSPERGYEPKTNPLTEFIPFVWAKIYLSTFTFSPPYALRREGRFTVVEIPARFRDGLESGDYPYPFWHSAKKWESYAGTRALLFVFEHDTLVAAYRRSALDSEHVAPRDWDSRWRWTDAEGRERPRVALFTYLLSSNNPWLSRLDGAYRALEVEFRGHTCVSCHSPDNPGKANPLLLLGFPNQALVARHTLVETLRGNKMPPADPKAAHGAGLADEDVRQRLLALAQQFEQDADAALAFERDPSAVTPAER